MKRIHLNFRAWLASLAALLAALPACADVTIDQLEFTEMEGGYSVSAKSGATLEGALVIPETYNGKPVVEIGGQAFYASFFLTNVTIPNTVTTIGYGAFYGSGLTSVHIGDGVTTIGGWAFGYCSDLTSVHIGAGVTTIGDAAFYECSGLTSLTIPDAVTTIGEYAFMYCSNLTSVHIGDGVTTIGNGAFGYCSGLTSVHIGDGITIIGASAFGYCSGLTEITCCATTPPNLFSVGSFSSSSYTNATVYVPEEAVESYRKDVYWSRFQNIVGKNLTSVGCIETKNTDDAASAMAVYDLRGTKVAASPEGLPRGTYIVRQGGASKKISVK